MITPAYSTTATERVLPRMALDFTTGVLDSRVTVARALNTATRVNSSGLIEGVNADLPRFDYDPITLAPKGLLIEEARTNLVTYSQDFSNAAWSKSNVTVTANTTVAPDGTTTADTLTASTTAAFTWQVISFTGNGDKAMSCFVKAGTAATSVVQIRDATAVANRGYYIITWTAGVPSVAPLTTGTVLGVDAFPDGWYRLRLLAPGVIAANSNQYRFLPDTTAGANTVIVWGAQSENGTFPTSYIPNLATGTTTRNADVVSMTGTNFSSWYNASEGTFVVEGSVQFGTTRYLIGGSASQRLVYGTSSGSLGIYDGTNVVNVAGGVAGQTFKIATSYGNAFGLAASLNGSVVAKGSYSGAFSVLTSIGIFSTNVGTATASGYAKKIYYYPLQLTDSEVRAFSK
jgi:hypothetical protein